jgi:hypothetical protein
VVKKTVKNLLVDWALKFNNLIYNIPPGEMVGSIAAMSHGSMQSIWKDIFFLAFNVHVSDQVFKEEVAYAGR